MKLKHFLILLGIACSNFLVAQEENIITKTDSLFFKEGDGLAYEIDPNADIFIIDELKVQVLDPLGRDISDSTRITTSFLKRTGNAVHHKTRISVLRKHLLFEEGDTVSKLQLTETERLLRQTLKIRDARVITHRNRRKGHYSVTVLIQDRLPFAAGYANINNNSVFSFSDQNLQGTGSGIGYEVGVPMNGGKVFHAFNFIDKNLGNSYVQIKMDYSTARNNFQNRIGVERPFISGLIYNAGGIQYRYTSSDEFQYQEDSISASYISKNQEMELWAGHAFNVGQKKISDHTNNIVIGARYLKNDIAISNIEYTNAVTNILNKTGDLLLFRVGFEKRRYFVDNYIYRFVYSEDIPTGLQFSITGGRSLNTFTSHNNLLNGTIGFANKHKFGYYNLRFSYTKSFSKAQALDNSNASFRALYLSPLLINGKFKNRIFFSTIVQSNTKDGYFDRFVLDNEDGFLNVNSELLTGITKTSFTVTDILYTPWYPLGFNIGFFAYGAVANLSALESKIIDKPWYQALGIGVLLRNENLMINEVRFSFTFYPSFPEDTYKLNPTWIYDLYIPDISVGKPDIY